MSAYPDDVYEFGAWLKAHPWVKRVKLDADTFTRYYAQIEADSRFGGHSGLGPDPFFLWRSRVAAILDRAWAHRREIWPERMYRGRA